MRKARVITTGKYNYHSFSDGDIVELIECEGKFFKFTKGGIVSILLRDEFEWIDKSDDFIVAAIGGKRYKCFPMKDGE